VDAQQWLAAVKADPRVTGDELALAAWIAAHSRHGLVILRPLVGGQR